jgi:hypothetical protein
MKSTGLIRLGGLAAMWGRPLYTFSTVGSQIGSSGEGPVYAGILLSECVLLVGAMGALVAIADLCALGEGSDALSGELLSVGAFIGVALLSIGELGVSPWAMLVGLMLTILLSLALGVVIIRSVHPLPWWCGVALIAWGLTSGFSALSVDLAAPWLRAILVGAPLTLVGYAIYRAGARLDEQLSRVR